MKLHKLSERLQGGAFMEERGIEINYGNKIKYSQHQGDREMAIERLTELSIRTIMNLSSSKIKGTMKELYDLGVAHGVQNLVISMAKEYNDKYVNTDVITDGVVGVIERYENNGHPLFPKSPNGKAQVKQYTIRYHEGSYQYDNEVFKGTLKDAKEHAKSKLQELHDYRNGKLEDSIWATFSDSEDGDEMFDERVSMKRGKFGEALSGAEYIIGQIQLGNSLYLYMDEYLKLDLKSQRLVMAANAKYVKDKEAAEDEDLKRKDISPKGQKTLDLLIARYNDDLDYLKDRITRGAPRDKRRVFKSFMARWAVYDDEMHSLLRDEYGLKWSYNQKANDIYKKIETYEPIKHKYIGR